MVRQSKVFNISNKEDFSQKLCRFFSLSKHFVLLNSNEYDIHPHCFKSFDMLAAVGCLDEYSAPVTNIGAFDRLKIFFNNKKDWMFGFLTYDLKNELESLSSRNHDGLFFPKMHFIHPELVFKIRENTVEAHYPTGYNIAEIVAKIEGVGIQNTINEKTSLKLQKRVAKKDYLSSVRALKDHIFAGDIYEATFSHEFFAENAVVDPFSVYLGLNKVSPSPFSCYLRTGDKYLMCASPERFLKKEGNKIFSQPIKGTIKRGTSRHEDQLLREKLANSEKDKSENVMIVDLMRNDLSRSACKGTVKTEELFGIYSFPQVHQMISTVSCELREDVHFIDAIKNAFPMGSMTGAPKKRAMELIEQFESTKRGLFSGSVGYITPEGDFDFNVVIRSILYNETEKYLSAMFGGAITALSDPEMEYRETLLKAKAVFNALGQEIIEPV